MKTALNSIIKKAIPVLKKYGVKRAGIFGSYARGEQKKGSDVDLLIQFRKKGKSLLDLVGLKLELESSLKRKVDLVEYQMIKQLIKEDILKEERRIL